MADKAVIFFVSKGGSKHNGKWPNGKQQFQKQQPLKSDSPLDLTRFSSDLCYADYFYDAKANSFVQPRSTQGNRAAWPATIPSVLASQSSCRTSLQALGSWSLPVHQ